MASLHVGGRAQQGGCVDSIDDLARLVDFLIKNNTYLFFLIFLPSAAYDPEG